VDAAREKINSMIEDLESQVTIECVIEQQHHSQAKLNQMA
jgi:hypothetical protein